MCQYAFLSCNPIGDPGEIRNGWQEKDGKRAFVLQNTRRQLPVQPTEDEINALWHELEKVAPELDGIVIYLSKEGSRERALELAKAMKDKNVVFVLCSCAVRENGKLLRDAGFTEENCQWRPSECGGESKMKALLDQFLILGSILF